MIRVASTEAIAKARRTTTMKIGTVMAGQTGSAFGDREAPYAKCTFYLLQEEAELAPNARHEANHAENIPSK